MKHGSTQTARACADHPKDCCSFPANYSTYSTADIMSLLGRCVCRATSGPPVCCAAAMLVQWLSWPWATSS